jgi:integrase
MSRPRDRASADGLLPRMEARPWADGKTVTYRYHAFGEKKPRNLGTDKIAAIRQVLDLLGETPSFGTLKWVWERYTDEQRPSPRWKKLAAGTQDDYRLAWKQIAKTFANMRASAITAPMIAQYVNIERASAPRRAVVEKSLLSNLFRHGITLGVCTANPAPGIEAPESEPRTEAPDELLLAGFLKWLEQQTPQRRIIGLAAEYASLSGSRKVEFLDLSWPQVDRVNKVVRTKRAKQRGKKRGEVIELVTISPNLDALLDRIAALNRDCLYLFPTRDNCAYTARGFKTLWQRCVLAAIDEKVLTPESRFTFHDLRAYYTSKHKRDTGALPDLHANPATTARVYDRNKEVKRSAL